MIYILTIFFGTFSRVQYLHMHLAILLRSGDFFLSFNMLDKLQKPPRLHVSGKSKGIAEVLLFLVSRLCYRSPLCNMNQTGAVTVGF